MKIRICKFSFSFVDKLQPKLIYLIDSGEPNRCGTMLKAMMLSDGFDSRDNLFIIPNTELPKSTSLYPLTDVIGKKT
jgi:hypothetical protein